MQYFCPPGTPEVAYEQSVIGTEIYYASSYICSAAVHAGLISVKDGGTVTFDILRETGDYFKGSERNGVKSRDFDYPGLAFRFVTGASARTLPQAPALSTRPQLGPDRDGWGFNSETGSILRFFGSPSVASCRAECEKDAKCMAFNWVKPGGYQPGDPPVCYLLSSWAGQVQHPCCISAVRN